MYINPVLAEALHLGIKEILKRGVYKVTFKKTSDGTIREMTCTLNNKLLPPMVETADVKPYKKPNFNVVSAYELGNDWRSFKVDSIIDFVKVEE